MRKMGSILLDMEKLLDEMYLEHELQLGDVLSLIYSHTVVHNPDRVEQYEEGGSPKFYYGPDKAEEGS